VVLRPTRLLVVLALLAGATACGQAQANHTTSPPHASTAPSPDVELAASATRTSHARSARIAMRMRMTVPPNGTAVTANATGVVGFRDRSVDLALHMAVPGAGTIRMREIMVWPVIYMRSPLFTAALHGKRWVKLDMARLERANGIDLSALASTGSNDPTEMLQTLENESDSLRNLGPATVRGVPTVHYRAVIDLAKAAKNAPAAVRAAVQRSDARLIEMLGTDRMPVDVWIGGDKLVRRLAYRMSVPVAATGGTMAMDLRLDMFDFGVPVHVTAPPAREVAELPAAATAATQ
jgi:hypothetical protein